MGKRHDLEKVLQVGDLLFRQQGYHDTGVEEILSKTDFPRSSFYYHFKSKEGFGERALEYYSNNLLQYMRGIFSDTKEESPLQRLKNYFFSIIDHFEREEFGSCCLIQRYAIEVGSEPNRLQAAAKKQFNKWVSATTVCILEAQEKGELRLDLSADQLARMLYDMLYGGATLARINRERGDFKRQLENFFLLVSI
ncbi:MAG: TetR/AcrR family transcriptional regulator [Saprospiraceae bacterium]|nr:TetR/AcrR family transcriptional regulator [Saprospiraceae bacterium]